MRYIRTVIVTVGTSQISKERKHFIRRTVRELLSFQFIPQGYFKKWNKSLPSSPRLSEVCWAPHAREVLPLGTPLLQHLPKPATWDSRVHLKFLPWPREFFFGRQFFDRQRRGKVFGCFKCSPLIVHSFCSLVAQSVVYLHCRRPGFNPWVGKISWRRKWQPTPVFLPEEFNGLRSLVGYSP